MQFIILSYTLFSRIYSSNVTILKGVTIGNNVVIGANCLIYKDIPDNSIVKLHSENIIERINCYEK